MSLPGDQSAFAQLERIITRSSFFSFATHYFGIADLQ
jgi:hypothetical protein